MREVSVILNAVRRFCSAYFAHLSFPLEQHSGCGFPVHTSLAHVFLDVTVPERDQVELQA